MGQQRKTGNSPVAPLLLLGTLLVVLLVSAGGLYGGSWLSKDGQVLPANPFSAPFLLIGNRATWSVSSTVVAGAIVLILLLVVIGILMLRARRQGKRSRVDHKAALMGRGAEIKDMTEHAARQAAVRFGVAGSVGVFLGLSVAGARRLYADYESVILQIWGPRQGKSSTQVIPQICDAPGAVLTTSNKPDVIDATRELRSKVGTVWAFDPQNISGDEATWWWNPLSYVTNDEKAASLAKIFADAGRDPDAKKDPYFDPAGRDLITDLVLAAAVGNKEIIDVYRWLQQGSPSEPLSILRTYRDGLYELQAGSLEDKINMPPEQKAGVFGTAIDMMQALKYQGIRRWVNPTSSLERRPHFDVHAFVRDHRDTLYVLSKEGGGSAAALTTALTVAVADAAEEYAMTCKGRRLPVPLIMPLDEIANVCPWADLPEKYSHYGSKGIIPIAFLQSWSQGVQLWGQSGMEKIWSSATVKVVGSGLSEEGFLRKMSNLIGEYTYDTMSESTTKTGRTRSYNQDGGKESIFTVSDLQELPRGRVVVYRAGARTALARTVTWQDGPHRAQIAASLAKHEPGPSPTAVTVPAADLPHGVPPASNRNRWIDASTSRKDQQ